MVFSFLLWTTVGGGGECLCYASIFFFAVDFCIIILMSYLYYFNQIAKNIVPLL